MYMFIPSALLGFIIGMGVWLCVLLVLRLYSSLRKMTEARQDDPPVDIIGDIKATLSEDPWKKISDAETVHGLDGTMMRKGDRVWRLQQESGVARSRPGGLGGSDRRPRAVKVLNESRASTRSEGKNMRF